MDEWWTQEINEINEISNDSFCVKYLCGRETQDGWEYAIVAWRYRIPALKILFKNGKIFCGSRIDA